MISNKRKIKAFSLIIAITLLVSLMAVPLAACDFDVLPDMFTVTFDTLGGSSVPSQMVERGSRVVQPNDPTRDGYEFKAWCKDADGINNGTFTLIR